VATGRTSFSANRRTSPFSCSCSSDRSKSMARSYRWTGKIRPPLPSFENTR
jgi:hypothetical protein